MIFQLLSLSHDSLQLIFQLAPLVTMQSNIELMQKKLARLEKALILATEEDVKFKLEHDIDELRQKIENSPK